MRSSTKPSESEQAGAVIDAVLSCGAFFLICRDRLWIYNSSKVDKALRLRAGRLAPHIQKVLTEAV
jgi:hypothetical protein